jgi:hypothetical protein
MTPVNARKVIQGLLEKGYTHDKTTAYIRRLIRSVNAKKLINDEQVEEIIATLNDVDNEIQLRMGYGLPIGHHLMVADWINRLEP